MKPPREDTLPWYKQFWPWFLISLPASVVIASLYTINLAIKTNDGLVSDDYYKEGLAIRKNADSTARAQALGIVGDLRYDADTGAVTIEFERPLAGKATTLALHITHPTLPDRDQTIQLTPIDRQHLTGRAEPLGPADWKLELRPDDNEWRVEGRMSTPGSTSARLD